MRRFLRRVDMGVGGSGGGATTVVDAFRTGSISNPTIVTLIIILHTFHDCGRRLSAFVGETHRHSRRASEIGCSATGIATPVTITVEIYRDRCFGAIHG